MLLRAVGPRPTAANLRDALQGDIDADCGILGEKCTLSFGAFTASEGHYVCEGTACDFRVGLEGLQCAKLECRCADVGCPTYLSSDIDEAVKKVTGPIKVSDPGEGGGEDARAGRLDPGRGLTWAPLPRPPHPPRPP